MFHKPIQIGDVLPAAPRQRGPQGTPCHPAWYALETPPQGEARAQRWLEAGGVEAWFPTQPVWRRHPRTRQSRQFHIPVVCRFVFTRFTGRPQWDVIFASRRVTGFIGVAGNPRPITDAEMARMAHVPDRIADLQRREAEARTVREGDTVTILDGAMAGWTVTVASLDAGVASFFVPILGDRETRISVTRLAKAQPIDLRT